MKLKFKVLVLLVSVAMYMIANNANCEVLAIGNWSEPVKNKYGLALRGRLLICEYDRNPRSGEGSDAALYIELQECSGFVGAVADVYYRPAAVDCILTDQFDNPVPNSPAVYGGGVPSPCWVALPSKSSIRLRISPYAGGRQPDGGFKIWNGCIQTWDLRPNDTNTYFLSGSFTVNPPTDRVPADFRWVWQGTIALPKMEVSIKGLTPQQAAARNALTRVRAP